jgi:hypothetical protein
VAIALIMVISLRFTVSPKAFVSRNSRTFGTSAAN